MIYNNVWGSITVMTQSIIAELNQIGGPNAPVIYLDWDAHANVNELPNADLVGPLAISISQESLDMYEVNFSIAVSTYATDRNLFRQRDYISRIFERMGTGRTIDYYNSDTASNVSRLVMTDGTLVSPMAKAELRPWQYVQGSALLLPVEE